MEGLYLKIENKKETLERYKLTRQSFIQFITTHGEHWKERPIYKNKLIEST